VDVFESTRASNSYAKIWGSAWHGYKFIDPRESGAIIPVVHVNGFKISERTIYGCMDDKELVCLFTGYGYRCRLVENLEDIDTDLCTAMEWAVKEIHGIQYAARTGRPTTKPRWPIIILRTPKGWGCPKKIHGKFVEGSFRAHQVPLPAAKSDETELKALQNWLESYNPQRILDTNGTLTKSILEVIPDDSRQLGRNKQTYDCRIPLVVCDWKDYSFSKGACVSALSAAGGYLDHVLVENPQSLRIFSPDELVSNRLDAAILHTGRNFQWDEFSRNQGGRVVEILSEHTCQG
jgi:xylulose-5-phosphate/fructose-6-phosphate phosphoketolase